VLVLPQTSRMTPAKSLCLCCALFLVCEMGAVTLPYLARNFEDECVKRGLHCHNGVQTHSQSMRNFVWDMKLRKKPSLVPPPVSGEI